MGDDAQLRYREPVVSNLVDGGDDGRLANQTEASQVFHVKVKEENGMDTAVVKEEEKESELSINEAEEAHKFIVKIENEEE